MWNKSTPEQASDQRFWSNALFVFAFVGLLIFTFLRVMEGIAEALWIAVSLVLLVRCWRLAAAYFNTGKMYRNRKRVWLTSAIILSLPFLLYPSFQLLITLILIWFSLESARLIQKTERLQSALNLILGINFKWLVIVAALFIVAMAIKPTAANQDYSPTKMNAPQ